MSAWESDVDFHSVFMEATFELSFHTVFFVSRTTQGALESLENVVSSRSVPRSSQLQQRTLRRRERNYNSYTQYLLENCVYSSKKMYP